MANAIGIQTAATAAPFAFSVPPQPAPAEMLTAAATHQLQQFQPVPAPTIAVAASQHHPPQQQPPPQPQQHLVQHQAHTQIPVQPAPATAVQVQQGQAAAVHQAQQVALLQQQQQQQHHQQQQLAVQQQLPLVQHQAFPQQTNEAALIQTFMSQKAQLTNYENQLRQRLMHSQSAEPMLQSQLFHDPRLLVGAGAQNVVALNEAPLAMALPSPHELTLRDETRRMRGGVIEPFPEKLHRLLLEVEAAGRSDVISFIADGKAFAIHNPDKFFKEIVPKYFRQSRLSSFKRQLNLYGFELINTGPARGGYYHEMFIKERPEMCRQMRRVAIKLHAKQQAQKEMEKKTATDNGAGENAPNVEPNPIRPPQDEQQQHNHPAARGA